MEGKSRQSGKIIRTDTLNKSRSSLTHYHNFSCTDSYCPPPVPIPVEEQNENFLHYCIEHHQGTIVQNDGRIEFNTAILKPMNYLTYNEEDRTFCFSGRGMYYVSWWFNIGGSGEADSLLFIMESEQHTQKIVAQSPYVISSQLHGNGLIAVNETPLAFYIRNASGGMIQFTTGSIIQGNITILYFPFPLKYC